MTSEDLISAFSWLGAIFQDFIHPEGPDRNGTRERIENAVRKAETGNPWFTRKNILFSLDSWADELTREKLEKWLKPYRLENHLQNSPVKIGVVMAGNIPMVGFHDFMCVLASGNIFLGKLSHKDDTLLPEIAQIMTDKYPVFQSRIFFFDDHLTGQEAIIATGSQNTSRYFEYYFGKYPHIIRKDRKSIAILTGEESPDELEALGKDVFTYFGMGCRNISKVFVPEGYNMAVLGDALSRFKKVLDHTRYRNNYEYQRSVFMVAGIPFSDNGCILFTESGQLSSPVGVLQYEYYNHPKVLAGKLESLQENIQCIVSREKAPFRWCLPGQSQHPALNDYADGMDTMEFLLSIKVK
ncbi:MAG: acyl-CoA reductase [Bacteroidota bacterium]|nr:acyl-CoA reductase [Bacteroidota bacterium]